MIFKDFFELVSLNSEGLGRKWSWLNRDAPLKFFWRDWRKSRTLGENSHRPGRDFSLALPEYKSTVLYLDQSVQSQCTKRIKLQINQQDESLNSYAFVSSSFACENFNKKVHYIPCIYHHRINLTYKCQLQIYTHRACSYSHWHMTIIIILDSSFVYTCT
jgi:hypothetical protein